MSRDPCVCDLRCPHGDRCLGGHADFPGSHWWPCEVCSPPSGVMYRLAHPAGQVLMIVAGCRHALGPGPAGEVTRDLVRHCRSCPDAVQPQTSWRLAEEAP